MKTPPSDGTIGIILFLPSTPYRRKLLHQLFLFFVCLLSYECICTCIMYLLEPFNFKNYPWYECTMNTVGKIKKFCSDIFTGIFSYVSDLWIRRGQKFGPKCGYLLNGFEFTNSNCTKIILIYRTCLLFSIFIHIHSKNTGVHSSFLTLLMVDSRQIASHELWYFQWNFIYM